MSKDMGLFVLFFAGALGLLALWVGSITMGFIGAALVRNLRPMVAAPVLFLFVAGAPVFLSVVNVVTAAQQKAQRRR